MLVNFRLIFSTLRMSENPMFKGLFLRKKREEKCRKGLVEWDVEKYRKLTPPQKNNEMPAQCEVQKFVAVKTGRVGGGKVEQDFDVYRKSQHSSPLHHPIQQPRRQGCAENSGVKCPGFVRDAVGDVHAEKRRNQRRNHEYDSDNGEAVDNLVEVVRDDARIGVHRAVEDVGIHVGHGKRLRIVDDDVFEQFAHVLVAVDVQEVGALHFHFEQFVGIERIDEIDEAFFDGEQLFEV